MTTILNTEAAHKIIEMAKNKENWRVTPVNEGDGKFLEVSIETHLSERPGAPIQLNVVHRDDYEDSIMIYENGDEYVLDISEHMSSLERTITNISELEGAVISLLNEWNGITE